MKEHAEVARELERAGYAVLPGRLSEQAVNAARATPYLGFIGGKHPRNWLMRGTVAKLD